MQLEIDPDAGGEWWLVAESVTSGGPLPVLGPLTANGFQLQYLDSTGNATAT